MDKEFTANDTKIMKGIAIILMLMHHLWAFPSRVPESSMWHITNIFGDSTFYYIGLFGKICVSIFFFLGGYGIYASLKKKKLDILKNIKRIFIAYWKVFLIFVPIGFIFFNNQIQYCINPNIWNRYSNFDWSIVIGNFLGIRTDLNSEWWFVRSYVIAILTFPLIKKFIDKHSAVTNVFAIAIASILVSNVFPVIGDIEEIGSLNTNFIYRSLFWQGAPYICCFWMGIAFAKDNLLVKLRNRINDNIKLNVVIDVLIILAIVYLSQTGIKTNLDIIYVPIFIIACLDIVKKSQFFCKVFYSLGNESTNMWLTHTFFCYYFYFFVQIVVWPKWGLFSLFILIALSFGASKLLNAFWNIIGIIYGLGKKVYNEKIRKIECK